MRDTSKQHDFESPDDYNLGDITEQVREVGYDVQYHMFWQHTDEEEYISLWFYVTAMNKDGSRYYEIVEETTDIEMKPGYTDEEAYEESSDYMYDLVNNATEQVEDWYKETKDDLLKECDKLEAAGYKKRVS